MCKNSATRRFNIADVWEEEGEEKEEEEVATRMA